MTGERPGLAALAISGDRDEDEWGKPEMLSRGEPLRMLCKDLESGETGRGQMRKPWVGTRAEC